MSKGSNSTRSGSNTTTRAGQVVGSLPNTNSGSNQSRFANRTFSDSVAQTAAAAYKYMSPREKNTDFQGEWAGMRDTIRQALRKEDRTKFFNAVANGQNNIDGIKFSGGQGFKSSLRKAIVDTLSTNQVLGGQDHGPGSDYFSGARSLLSNFSQREQDSIWKDVQSAAEEVRQHTRNR